MSLRIRRGTEAQRTGLSTIDEGELLWVTNAQKLYVGLGNGQAGNNGMVNVGAALAGDGLAWDEATQTLKFGGVNYTTDDVQEGVMVGRQYFTEERAVDAVAAALVAGQGNITFVYNTTQDNAGRIDANITLDGVGITSVEADTSPTLGGDLDANGNDITGALNIGLTGSLEAGDITINNGVFTTAVLAGEGNVRTDNRMTFGTNAVPNTLWIESDNNFIVMTGLSDGTNNAGISSRISRGTKSAPAIVQPGDSLAFIDGAGYDGTDYAQRGGFGLFADPSWNGTVGVGSSIPSSFGAVVLDEFDTISTLAFSPKGVLSVPVIELGDGSSTHPSIRFSTDGGIDTGIFHPADGVLCISTDTTERVRIDNGGMRVQGFIKVAQVSGTLPSPAEAGMIVLDGTTFKGYNGSAWVTLN